MRFLGTILFLLYACIAFTQSYSNDWIDYSKRYFRIPIVQEGIYRITHADLVANGISIGDFDPRNIEIYHRGELVPVFVQGQENGIFNAGDYIEFYAMPNDGWLDAKVYKNEQPVNPGYSLYNDTATYFLTFANSLSTYRYDTTRNTNFTGHTPLTYCWKTARTNYTSFYNYAEKAAYFSNGEGWVDDFFDMGQERKKLLSTPNFVNVGLPYTLKFGIAGISQTRHDIIVQSPHFVFDTTFTNYNAVHKTLTINQSLTSVTEISFKSTFGNSKPTDKNSIAYVEIKYPHNYNFQGRNYMRFTIPKVTSGSFVYFEIVNFDGGAAPYVFCPELNKRFEASPNGTNRYRFLLPNPGKEVECIIVNPSAYKSVPKIISTRSRNTTTPTFFDLRAGSAHEGDYIIITHHSLWFQAQAYKEYRESTGFTVVMVDVDELYNQFAYGIQKHPYAIQAFIEYATKEWTIKPKYVFIIGKGLHLTLFRNNPEHYKNTLVPSMGGTASDLLLASDLRGSTMRTHASIGRLAAKTPAEVAAYRNKVEEHEAQLPHPWMKTVMHFGGGANTAEQNLFRFYLRLYETTMRNEYFGADVYTFLKQSSNVFEKTEPEIIKELMNSGTSFLNFFGHSTGNTFDQNIDHPSQFNNKGKYPLLLANSCFSGDIFTALDFGISESWVLIPDKGAIGFIANVDLGVPQYLNAFTHSFIRNISYHNYGNSIGSSISLSLTELSNKYPSNTALFNSTMSFILHGDPAVKLHSFEFPDLEVTEASVFFTPSFISSDLQTFTTNLVIQNNARATSESFTVSLLYTSSSGKELQIDTIVQGSYFRDTLVLTHDLRLFETGTYTLTVTVDSENDILETNESNNTTTVEFFISSRDVLPIYPYEYAIIPNNTTELIISAVDPLRPPQEILIEIDTCADFTSTKLVSETITNQNNAIIRWTPPFLFEDNQTYFWRVSNAADIKWNESSFTYEASKTGWGQIRARQFIKNNEVYLTFDEASKTYSFIETPHGLFCATKGMAEERADYFATLYMIDNTTMGISGFPLTSPALHIAVIDSITAIPWLSNRDNFGHRNYPGGNEGRINNYYAFTSSNTTSLSRAATFLKDSVPDGNYVLMYTFKTANFALWPEALFEAFDSLGATLPRTLATNIPYIYFGRKGDSTTVQEAAGQTETDLIQIIAEFPSNYFQGTITSTRIGPAKAFDKAVWNYEKIDVSDSTTLTLFGVPADNNLLTLERWITADTVYRLDTIINADLIPHMKLQNFQYDNLLRTPSILDYWKVYYNPVGELAIAPEHTFYFYGDTVQQGEFLEIRIAAQNIGVTALDSVLVLLEIRNAQNQLVYSEYQRYSVLEAQEYIVSSFSVHTVNLSGSYTAKIEFNPVNPETGLIDQPETYIFNNFVLLPFFVQHDIKNPLIDVIVDGRHVLHGDYISANPEIIIRVYDENNFLFLQDTSLFTLYAIHLGSGKKIPFYFADSAIVQFIPADDSTHQCMIILRPEFFEDGDYELYIQARDVTGNFAGVQEYILFFRIEQSLQISVLYNFPNPCSSFTTFRFTLTGTETPNNARIEILSNQGIIVKEIHIPKEQLYIGTNSIDVSFHQHVLPNGVYIYRLLFDDQFTYEHYKTEHDAVMHKRYEKLFISR